MSVNKRMLKVRALHAAQAAVLGVMFAGCLASGGSGGGAAVGGEAVGMGGQAPVDAAVVAPIAL